MEKVFGVVILFNPQENVNRNISSYLSFVDKLLVIDNSEPPAKINLGELEEKDKVVLIAEGVNKGIAIRLNEAAKYAFSEGASWLLTMDQDSFFNESNLVLYQEYFHQYKNKDNVALFGVEFEQPSGAIGNETVETYNIITSGSLVNLEVYKNIGEFDEALFIDDVDVEYCIRANLNGYKTLKFKNVYLHHSLGTVLQYRSLKSFKKTSRVLHSSLRIYYMLRNHLYVNKKYKSKLPELFLLQRKKDIRNRIKNNFLYGGNRIALIKYLVLALVHYKNKKMGRL
ncbi:MAG TPA: glycosyltransferase [Niabella sp.]|nr:glycosyltransferase [Niabella sp.]